MPAQYVCSFKNPKTGERCEALVILDKKDEEAVAFHRDSGGEEEVLAMALALRHAYQTVPKGFLHDRPPELRRLQ
jgi:hypothetical protein